MGVQRLKDLGFGGYAGWGDVEAEADFAATGGQGKETRKPSPTPSIAGPSSAEREAFQTRLRGEEEEFLGRFRTEFPEIISGIEGELGLPGLRQTAFGLSEGVRKIPEVTEVGTRGFDVTANQLSRMIAAEQGQQVPLAQEAVRQAQFGEQLFEERAQRELVPFETELGLMKDRFSREATGFNTDVEARLNILLEQMRQEGARDITQLQEATKLAQLEQDKLEFEEGISTIDLGNRVAIIDRNGNEIGSFPKGATPTAGGGGTGFISEPPTGKTSLRGVDLQTLWDFNQPTQGGSATFNF